MYKVTILFISLFFFTDDFSLIRQSGQVLFNMTESRPIQNQSSNQEQESPVSVIEVNQADGEHQSLPIVTVVRVLVMSSFCHFQPYSCTFSQVHACAKHRPPRLIA
jgi:hypothetical protein